MDNKEITLAFDQSTTATGWSVFEGSELKDFGIFKPSGNRNERIEKTRVWAEELIDELSKDVKIDYVLEEIQLQNNVETFKSLAHLQGVLINVGLRKQKEDKINETVTYFSSAWKSTCGVKGKARKEQKANAKLHVESKYGIDAEEDACDAICIGEHHVHEQHSVINFE